MVVLFFIDFLEERECVERHGRIKHYKNQEKLHHWLSRCQVDFTKIYPYYYCLY